MQLLGVRVASGPFHEPEAEKADKEIGVGLNVRGDAGEMMNAGRHSGVAFRG
jgi:hypothetical protein